MAMSDDTEKTADKEQAAEPVVETPKKKAPAKAPTMSLKRREPPKS